ncbi:MAG: 4Fe-4S dicluster domain-containing protein, partial [Thermoplasmata archaeon]
GKEIKGNVVMIGCVGSRTKERGYCSRVCCTHAMKNAVRILSKKDANVHYICRDVRTYGFNELLYKQAAEKGLVTIRYDDENMPKVDLKEGMLIVQVFDNILGRTLNIKADLLVLANAIIPNSENSKLAKMLKVPLTKDGFFLEAHMKLRPVDFATEGIFVCGLAHSPKFLRESIAQACAASARAATILAKDRLESEGIIAVVNEDLCDGCGICAPICDYKAIEIVDDSRNKGKKIAKVNEGLCKGCGACAGACPSGAMEQKGFKNSQLIAMIDSALEEWRC